MTGPDSVTVTTRVAVDPATAFEIFTAEVDAWWKHGPRFRFRPERSGVLRFEGGAGGRLVEVYDEAGDDAYEVGRVLAWEPPTRLVFEMRFRSFREGETTEVEVGFAEEAGGTRVTVLHRGFAGLPRDHPARHGLSGPAFHDLMGAWWADLLVAGRTHAERRG